MPDIRLIFGLLPFVFFVSIYFIRSSRKRELRDGIIKLPSGERVDRLSDPHRFEELNKENVGREIICWLVALVITGYWVRMMVNLADVPFGYWGGD
jgi:hypothetical protein